VWSTRYSCQILMKLEFSRQIFEKYKFHENPSSASRTVPYGRTDGWADMTELTFAFRNFANAPTNDGPSAIASLSRAGWMNLLRHLTKPKGWDLCGVKPSGIDQNFKSFTVCTLKCNASSLYNPVHLRWQAHVHRRMMPKLRQSKLVHYRINIIPSDISFFEVFTGVTMKIAVYPDDGGSVNFLSKTLLSD
jgi:hypothetical protein